MFHFILETLSQAVETIDDTLEERPAHQIILLTAALYFLYNQAFDDPWIGRAYRSRHNKTFIQHVVDFLYTFGMMLPFISQYIIRPLVQKELDKQYQADLLTVAEQRKDMRLRYEIPQEGLSIEDILSEMELPPLLLSPEENNTQLVVKPGDGQDSGALYTVVPNPLKALLKHIYGETMLINPLHEKWQRVKAMQSEVIHQCLKLFDGPENGYGLITHGGTSSILEAMIAYVALARKNGIRYPEIVVPTTAHAAFDKAAHGAGATLIKVPVDPRTGAVDPRAMAKKITRNTAVIVGSAPSYPFGICDPIRELGQLAIRHKVPLHVDGCLGGFFWGFLEIGKSMNLRVPGVSSLSADLHKYGLLPKGISFLGFSENSPVTTAFPALNWPGSLYTTPGLIDGSSSGVPVATAKAEFAYYGYDFYHITASEILSLRQQLQTAIDELSYKYVDARGRRFIYVFGDPQLSLLGFKSDIRHPHLFADQMKAKGWELNYLQEPFGFHFCLTQVHTQKKDFVALFIQDLEAAIVAVMAISPNAKPQGTAKVYGTVGLLPSAIQEEVCELYQRARLEKVKTTASVVPSSLFSAASTSSDSELAEKHSSEQSPS